MQSVRLLEKVEKFGSLVDGRDNFDPAQLFLSVWQPQKHPEMEHLSWGDFWQLAGQYRQLFKDVGLKRGDTLILLLPQGSRLMAAFTGAMQEGIVPTILAYPNFKLHPEKYRTGLEGVTRNIRAALILVDPNFPDNYLDCLAGSEGRTLREPVLPDAPTGPPALANRQGIAFLQHSAGTTGLQKGVALSHQTVLNQVKALIQCLRLGPEDRIASWLPLYHDMGLVACFILPLVTGIPIVMESPVDWVMDPGSYLRLISQNRCTLGWVPNFTFQFLARRVAQEDREKLDLSSLRALITTSEPIRLRSLLEFQSAFSACGLRPDALQTSYGMAENTFAVTNSPMVGQPRAVWLDGMRLRMEGVAVVSGPSAPNAASFVSCGQCLPETKVNIRDENGSKLAEGRVGEIWVSSPCLFSGYYNRPDLTRRVLFGDWYRTGDMGFLLGEDLFVIGRKDDTIIVGGKNIYPQDVEEITCSHPDIHDGRAVAFGIENPELGTQDLVIVAEAHGEAELSRSQEIESEIRQTVVSELDVAPRFVRVVPPMWLVKSSAGKPARSTNRERFLELLNPNRERETGGSAGR